MRWKIFGGLIFLSGRGMENGRELRWKAVETGWGKPSGGGGDGASFFPTVFRGFSADFSTGFSKGR